MTDTKLREARIAEAKRLAVEHGHTHGSPSFATSTLDFLAMLYETDWRPEPEVDAVTLAAREWGAKCEPFYRENYLSGAMDGEVRIQDFRAGHAHALANCADVRRMDWLERQSVNIMPMKSGEIAHPFYSGDDLRTKIDRAMEGGQ